MRWAPQHIRAVDGPVEDGPLHELAFANSETVLPLPSYTRWWRTADHAATFVYHERMLRMLQSRRHAWKAGPDGCRLIVVSVGTPPPDP